MLKPGRETDARVAEVLGWRSIHFERHGDHENAYGQPTPTSHDCTPVPHYSTSPADAIAALEATGSNYTISKYGVSQNGSPFVWRYLVRLGSDTADAPTLPLAAAGAICKWGESKPASPLPRPAAEETA